MNWWGQCCQFWVWGPQALVWHCNTAHSAKEPLGLTWWKQRRSCGLKPSYCSSWHLLNCFKELQSQFLKLFQHGSKKWQLSYSYTVYTAISSGEGLSPLVLLFGHCGGYLGGDVMREKTRSLITNLLPLMPLCAWLNGDVTTAQHLTVGLLLCHHVLPLALLLLFQQRLWQDKEDFFFWKSVRCST